MKRATTRKQSGQALVELAFMLPILLLLLLGVIEVGRYAYISILIGNAAQAGAFYGAQGNAFSNDTTGISHAAQYDFAGATSGTSSTNGQPVGNLSVSSVVACGCDAAGTITAFSCNSITNPSAGTCASGSWVVVVSVTCSGSFSGLFNYPGIPSPVAISKTASMRVAS
ncbi:MAG TPA: TadE/TadG family type IV pilus assembly protein [Candidatus Eisenbacteria bacterium]|jgi:Flp pilus assembly protein TadG|nr:TadE/TadG family type IV pilus assembly protein [Candidatus Eisenbacteria bacterium]